MITTVGATMERTSCETKQGTRERTSVRTLLPLMLWLALSAGCGGITNGMSDAARPPNGRFCNRIIPGQVTAVEPERRDVLSPYMCAPGIPAGTPCDFAGLAGRGVCRDFVAESNGYYAEFARQNRVPLYCWPPDLDPCQEFALNRGPSACVYRVECVAIANPRPGGPTYMCPPEPCN